MFYCITFRSLSPVLERKTKALIASRFRLLPRASVIKRLLASDFIRAHSSNEIEKEKYTFKGHPALLLQWQKAVQQI